MRIFYGESFVKSSKKLPIVIKKRLAKSLEILSINPYHSTLHTKRLSGSLAGFLSFRITRDYRVVFYFISEDTIRIVEVAHRKEIYR